MIDEATAAQPAPKRRAARLVFLILLVLGLAGAAWWYFLWHIPSAATPEGTVSGLIAAWQADDEHLADSYFSASSRAELDRVRANAIRQGWKFRTNQVRWFKDESRVNTVSADIGHANISGDSATVPVTFTMSASSRFPRHMVRMRYTLIREGDWKVHGWATVDTLPKPSPLTAAEQRRQRQAASQRWNEELQRAKPPATELSSRPEPPGHR